LQKTDGGVPRIKYKTQGPLDAVLNDRGSPYKDPNHGGLGAIS